MERRKNSGRRFRKEWGWVCLVERLGKQWVGLTSGKMKKKRMGFGCWKDWKTVGGV